MNDQVIGISRAVCSGVQDEGMPIRVSYSLAEVTDAYMYGDQQAPAVDAALTLSPAASCLADVLGRLWFHRRTSVRCD